MRLLRVGHVINLIALLLLAGVYLRALAYTPVEASQGLAQKIFYLHVPAAIWAETAMIFVGLASIFYLFTKDPRLDRFAASSAEVGTIFCAIVLTTGPIWGKPIWGTWWSWDARLTFTLFLFLLYVGYLLLRNAVPDPGARARFAAVLGICGMCEVPFIHLFRHAALRHQRSARTDRGQRMTPQNGGYMIAAYVVVAAILIGYTLSLYLRARRSLRS
ncbi:MAG: cytochrome C assembly protein [Gemmatimonadetes bacterium]|nr:MAG: cytochrome C assembly protein [Gemmatimonadota bacterium]